MSLLSDAYRRLPHFKGKKRIGKQLFRNTIYKKRDMVIPCQGGLKYHILNSHDSVGRDLFFDGIYEPVTVNKICSLMPDGGVMVDAGANIGAISLPVARRGQMTVYAFEPARGIFDVLKKNIALNGLRNVKAVHTGLSDSVGTLDFYESDRVHGWSGMVKIDSFQNYLVPVTTLDAFAAHEGIDSIDVLKMDVQGWEYRVLKGAERLIDEGRIPHIVFEFEWWAEQNAGLAPGTAQRFLMEKGYTIETLDGQRLEEPLLKGSLVLWAWR